MIRYFSWKWCVSGLLIILGLTGCASITTGTTQSISVETRMSSGQEVIGANCRLVNSKGTWFITTPGSVTIHRATMSPLDINCTKEGQRQLGVSSIKPKSKGMTWGNLVFGGVIGVVTDSVTGAAGYYPSPITVIMEAIVNISGQQPSAEGASAGSQEGSGLKSAGRAQPGAETAPAEASSVGSGQAVKPVSDWREWGSKDN